MNLVALAILFGNLAVIFNPVKFGLNGVPGLLDLLPPGPRFAAHDAFLMTGMFSGYPDSNTDLVVRGHRRGGDWFELELSEHFPRGVGPECTRMWATRYWDMAGARAQRAGWKIYTEKIRARHNRLHPDDPIDRVELGSDNWPLSTRGYRAAKTPEQTRFNSWYIGGAGE